MSQTVKVVWEIVVEVVDGATMRDVVQGVVDANFQERIAAGEPDTACVFTVCYPEGHAHYGFDLTVDLSEPV